MRQVTQNDSVTIEYEGLLPNGETFESAKDTGPLQFQLGSGSVMPVFEQAVLGMTEGETKTITVPAREAYGLRDENLVVEVPRGNFGGQELRPGMVLGMKMKKEEEEHTVPATVTGVTAEMVTVDFNHPLAGQEITYKISLRSIDTAPASSGCGCKGGCGRG
ncbi:MAG: FKBP-type peptidyl-prolyl cis-trans isomerase [Thermodesulfobacteriota bacterium]